MSGIQKPTQGIEKSIEALRSGELTPEEAQRVREELQKISPEHLKELDDFTRSEIQRLISEIDNQWEEKPRYSLENISERTELTHIKESFLSYFQEKVSVELSDLSTNERESLKLLLWSEFLKVFSSTSALGGFLASLEEKAGKTLEGLGKIKEGDTQSLSEMLESSQEALTSFFSLPEANDILWETYEKKFIHIIEQVKNYKKEHQEKDISELSVLKKIIYWEDNSSESSEEIYKNIETQTQEIANSLTGKKELGTRLADTIEKLPLGMGDSVKEFMKGLVEKWPILGFLVGLIMGPDFLWEFLSEEAGRRKKSLQTLFALSKDSSSSISWVFPEDLEKTFDYDELEGFFQYLEEEQINYTDDSFWEEILSGKSQNEKIQKISSLMKTEHGKNIFEKKDSEDNGKIFAEKLNNVEALMHKEEKKQEEQELRSTAAALPSLTVSRIEEPLIGTQQETPLKEAPVWDDSKPESIQTEDITQSEKIVEVPDRKEIEEKKPIEITPEIKAQFIAFRDTVIETSIKNAYTLPVSLSYQGKENDLKSLGIKIPKSIDFKNGSLSIDNKKYATKFEDFTVQGYTIKELQILGTPRLSRNLITLECQTENLGFLAGVQKRSVEVEKWKLIEIVQSLLWEEKYVGKIPAQNDTPEISFEIS